MASDSESDHRDDESVASEEEVEEVKPKSALKKTREVLPPVERPELPYVFHILPVVRNSPNE
jgi:translation initiation factor 2 subunit 3